MHIPMLLPRFALQTEARLELDVLAAHQARNVLTHGGAVFESVS
jgi:hypothetical protein